MYRTYENSWVLEAELEEAQAEYQKALDDNLDDDALIFIAERLWELKERVNFAWQDEYEDEY